MSDQIAHETTMALEVSPSQQQKSESFSAVSLDEEQGTGIPGVKLEETEVQETTAPPVAQALQRLKLATETRLRCTKQILSERFGKGTRTVDAQLDERIATLRETQRKYALILTIVRRLSTQVRASMETQQTLGDMFAEYSVHTPELLEEFKRNSDVQRQVSRNGESLLAIMLTFESSLDTLSRKTIEDTLLKVKEYESARLEYDAFRTDLEQLRAFKVQNPGNTGKALKLERAEADFEIHRSRYDRMRSELAIKLQLLDENKTKVMQNQLVLFHNACCAFYTSDATALAECLQKFHIKLPPSDRTAAASKDSAKFTLLPVAAEDSAKSDGSATDKVTPRF
eukprot:scpid77294/ scgid13997/ Arfaptin-1; ADP-ribosylation factor-interacting protein 1